MVFIVLLALMNYIADGDFVNFDISIPLPFSPSINGVLN